MEVIEETSKTNHFNVKRAIMGAGNLVGDGSGC